MVRVPGELMEIHESDNNGIVVLGPVGNLDTRTCHEFDQRLDDLLSKGSGKDAAARPARLLVLDFGEVEYVSSAGLRVLLRLAKRLDRSDGRLVLCSINEQIQRVFDISGFTRYFTMVASQPEALKHLAAAAKQAPEDPRLTQLSKLAVDLLATGDGDAGAWKKRLSKAENRTDIVSPEFVARALSAPEFGGETAPVRATRPSRPK